MMIDAVITYVDASDKYWVDQYTKYVKRPLEEVKNRYRSYGVLDLQIACIRKFMPFVNKIFVIVSSKTQVPKNVKGLEDVFIVTHNEIIPKPYLPCFNSCTIEMFLSKIKGLSEQFLYFNDDVFPVKECKVEDFFIDDKICMNYELNYYDEETASVFQHNIINSTKPFYKNNVKFNAIKPMHSIMPMFKSKCQKIFGEHTKEILGSLTRTRHRKNMNAYLFLNYMYSINKHKRCKINYEYTELGNDLRSIKDDTQILCVNDNGFCDFEISCQELRKFFECILIGKSYEAPKIEINKKDIGIFEKIVVTFTSWKARIHNCKNIVINILNQSVKPDRIYLNLSLEEFPNKENDLPKDLVELSIKEKSFIINWIEGPNTKTFKKVFPILKYLNDDDLIFWTDDDLILPKDTLKSRIDDFKQYGQPISGISKNKPENVIYRSVFNEVLGLDKIVGSTACSMAQAKMLKGFDYIKSNEIIRLFNDDIIYATLCYLNGYTFQPCSGYSVWRDAKLDKTFISFMQDDVALSKSVNNNYYQNSVLVLNEVKLILEKNKDIILSKNIFKLSRFFSIIKPNVIIYSCCLNNEKHKSFPKINFNDSNLTYIMYTDDNTLNDNDIIDGWKIVKPKSKYIIVQDINKDIKWHPFEISKNGSYDISMYMDSKVDVLINPNDIILKIIDKLEYGFTCSIYDYRPKEYPYNDKDVYKHIDYLLWYFIIKQNNPNYKYKDNMLLWKNTLLKENYPENSLVLETAVVITNLHNINAEILENQIFDKYNEVNTLRDQIVVPYILWKNNIDIKKCGILGNYCTDKYYFRNNSKTNVNGR